jgi:hypothetical protein
MEDNQLACVKQVIHLQYRIDFFYPYLNWCVLAFGSAITE